MSNLTLLPSGEWMEPHEIAAALTTSVSIRAFTATLVYTDGESVDIPPGMVELEIVPAREPGALEWQSRLENFRCPREGTVVALNINFGYCVMSVPMCIPAVVSCGGYLNIRTGDPTEPTQIEDVLGDE